MSFNIPASLNWLVRKRAEISHRLKTVKGDLRVLQLAQGKERQKLAELIFSLKDDIDAIDRTLSIHDIPIDGTKIKPRRKHATCRFKRRGQQTAGILRCLAERNGENVKTTEVVAYMIQLAGLQPESGLLRQFHINIRQRLKILANQGRIRRMHGPIKHHEGQWASLQSGEKEKPMFQAE